MLNFCLQSLFREYGWQFMRRVVAPHPLRTAKALLDSSRRDYSGDLVTTSDEMSGGSLGGRQSIVGVGFCLKPLNPPCPSGHANHDCQWLERLEPAGIQAIPECCRQCVIREIGIMAFKAGAAFYIMTSARDILLDMFTPALNEDRFTSGLFVICRYSLQPFTIGLLASGIEGWLFPFEQGDCRDYQTWLRADHGVKDEQTLISPRNRQRIRELLGNATKDPEPFKQCQRRGNILCPL